MNTTFYDTFHVEPLDYPHTCRCCGVKFNDLTHINHDFSSRHESKSEKQNRIFCPSCNRAYVMGIEDGEKD